MKYVVLLALLLVHAVTCGCESLAKHEVRAAVQAEEGLLQRAKSRVHDPEVEAYLQDIADTLLSSARRLSGADSPGFKPDETLNIYDRFKVFVVHDAAPNAFVVGDDFACVTTALLLLAETPEEVALVLGHEFGHLRGGHLVGSIMRRQTTQLVAGIAMGVSAGVASYNAGRNPYYSASQRQWDAQNTQLLGAAILASYRPYDPADEHESDAIGVELMAASGYPLDRCHLFFERMAAKYGDSGGATHPKNSARIQQIRAAVAKHPGYVPTRFLDHARYQVIRDRVRQATLSAANSDTIVFYSKERQALAGNSALAPLQACGPLYASPDLIVQEFVKLVAPTAK